MSCLPCSKTCPSSDQWPGQICPIPGSDGGKPVSHPVNCCFNTNASCYDQSQTNPSQFKCAVNACESIYTNRSAECDANNNIISCKPGFELDPNYDRSRPETACQVTQNYNDIMLKYVGYNFVNYTAPGSGGEYNYRDIKANSLVSDTSTGVCADFKDLLVTQGLDMVFGIDPAVGTVRCSGYMQSSGTNQFNQKFISNIIMGFQPTDGNKDIKSIYTDQQKNDQLWNVANTVANQLQDQFSQPTIDVNHISGYTYKSLGN